MLADLASFPGLMDNVYLESEFSLAWWQLAFVAEMYRNCFRRVVVEILSSPEGAKSGTKQFGLVATGAYHTFSSSLKHFFFVQSDYVTSSQIR